MKYKERVKDLEAQLETAISEKEEAIRIGMYQCMKCMGLELRLEKLESALREVREEVPFGTAAYYTADGALFKED